MAGGGETATRCKGCLREREGRVRFDCSTRMGGGWRMTYCGERKLLREEAAGVIGTPCVCDGHKVV